jgi:hypothetical protein
MGRHAASALLITLTLAASSALGQAQRTFVSGSGNDSNACSVIAPCRTFNRAIAQTASGGEVIVLDSAGYGPLAIKKAISIISPPGVYAGISVFLGDGIDINAGASDVVILRGLTINNQGSFFHGIVFSTGGTLHVESCVVNGFFNGFGIFSGTGVLEVKDSTIRANGTGISVEPPSGTAVAAIDHVRLVGNNNVGLTAGGGSHVTIANSTASANTRGLRAFSQTPADAELNVENCVASNNVLHGILALSSSTGIARVRVANSIVTNNANGLITQGAPAVLLSQGNNTVEGNTSNNTTGNIAAYTMK